jgi:hypothetical protein
MILSIDENSDSEKFHWSSMTRKYSNLTGRHNLKSGSYSIRYVIECCTHVALSDRITAQEHECVRDWCQAHFGDNWTYNFDDFYFKNSQDALLFALRWAGDAG